VLARALGGMLFGVTATDPLTFLGMPAILTMVAVAPVICPLAGPRGSIRRSLCGPTDVPPTRRVIIAPTGGTMHREDQFIPELIVRGGVAALDFYKNVFGAEEIHRMTVPGSEKLMHGELTLDGHKFFVCDSSRRVKEGPASRR